MDDKQAKELIEQGYSPCAVAMCFGAVGTAEYYEAYKKYGGNISGRCPNCGDVCFGTGDCNCTEE